jgi:hypothetical protein
VGRFARAERLAEWLQCDWFSPRTAPRVGGLPGDPKGVRQAIKSARHRDWRDVHMNDSRLEKRAWVPTVFSKNRDRPLGAEVARKFLSETADPQAKCALLSDEHFSVDAGSGVGVDEELRGEDGSGTRRSPGRNGERDFQGEKRSNDTHASTTEPEAVSGTVEREAATAMIVRHSPGAQRITVSPTCARST